MADLISLNVSTMPITVVSSLTVNVTAELEGSKVQCLGFTANIHKEIKSGSIHITGDYYFLIRHIKDVLPLLKWRVLRRLYIPLYMFVMYKPIYKDSPYHK